MSGTMRDVPYRHPLAARTQFVAVETCGCPIGVREGSTVPNVDVARYFLANNGDRRILLDWRRRGVRVVHVSHDEYEATHLPNMLAGCPHRQRGGTT
jgi:hypothetical protein